jgi:hypothetical protein
MPAPLSRLAMAGVALAVLVPLGAVFWRAGGAG